MEKRIGTVVAMDSELEMLVKNLGLRKEPRPGGLEFLTGTLPGGAPLVVCKSGIGKVNAALGVSSMIEHYGVSCVVSTGVCGVLCRDGSISQKDIIVSSQAFYHDVWCGFDNAPGQVQGLPAVFPALSSDAQALEQVRTTVEKAYGGHVVCAPIASGDWFVDTVEKAEAILEEFPSAVGVDMESGAIAQTCTRYGVPWLSMRMVSDSPLSHGSARQYADFWSIAPGGLSIALGAALGYLQNKL